ncbi:crotonase/enoyl-CoA hydratase family protein [Calidifontibacter sp. DB0510]|uniref:Crotonase/enoyl-CoA hydratase family protein n=1 Tax=Metallococcus carri TaxID=1656884 RepID=A0A967EHG0_9MICO|nr:crotonase/enoyl-CoA hydratase family protein [Metallococcus carri]NHN56298.1 crotonase/enoyl-CoA hydratase family protein [Metallococcus carri]NOP38650.1 crotonase/enoyl-CoA hydratase family protein [Calidifontibacter sp. DB2511S]
MASLISSTVTDGIADVRLNRPDKLNGLTFDMLRDLASTAHRLRRDRSLRAVVLSGEGESFCAGLDFASVAKKPWQIPVGLIPNPVRGTNVFQEACWAWRRVPVPVIAAVQGHCYGGGVQIVLAADFRVTAPDAKWSVLEGKWGLIPDMTGIRTLSDLVGIETAKRLTMTAEVISGERAHELGLAGTLSLEPYADALAFARELSSRSPDALAGAKKLFDTRFGASPRRTFAAERRVQVGILLGRNAKIARAAGLRREAPTFVERGTR